MKEFLTDSVPAAATLAQSLSTALMGAFYQLTALYPRLIPTNSEEVERLKYILVTHFGLKDDPRTWATVLGQVCSVKPISMRKPYTHYANVGKRLYINEAMNNMKMLEIEKLQVMLEKKLKVVAEERDARLCDGASDNQGELCGLRPIEEGMVPTP